MPLTSFSNGQVADAADVNGNFALCVLTDTVRTIGVTHDWNAPQDFAPGTVLLPGIILNGDVDTGLYEIAAGRWGWASAGSKVLDFQSTGLGVTGTITSSGALTVTAGGLTVSAGGADITGTLAVTGAVTVSSTLAVTGTTALTGNVGIGAAVQAFTGLRLAPTMAGGTTVQYGMFASPTFDSGTTISGTGVRSRVATAASAFTMGSAYAFFAANPSKGSGSAITTAYGLYVEALTAGANNYAIYTNAGLVRFGDAVTIASGGLTVTTGGVVVTAGGLTVSAGGATITGNGSFSGTLAWGGGAAIASSDSIFSGVLEASTTWNPPSVAANSQISTTVSVPGAVVGDAVAFSNPWLVDNIYLELQAYVSAADTVTLSLLNQSSSAVDAASRTVKIFVLQ